MVSELHITGGTPLSGSVRVNGAKNSVLPILAATIINAGINEIHNCPDLKDVQSAIKILRHLGCKVERSADVVMVDSSGFCRYDIPDDLMREMRSSVIFLGPILARCGKAQMTFPGGCEIGPRPIDLHLAALSKMGVRITENYGELLCECENPVGCEINLSLPSVGATENIMLFATACRGKTRIINAAREPEIHDLQEFLAKTGAQIHGAGFHDIEICGSKTDNHASYTVMPDRIEASTYLCACAATGGKIEVTEIVPSHLAAVTAILSSAGCIMEIGKSQIAINAPKRLSAVPVVRTTPYPGFPTDAQSPLMASLCTAEGTTIFIENMFDNRYRHCAELARMGANIRIEGKVAIVSGVRTLTGARVASTDLRGGAAMVVAALGAQGESIITQIEHIDRGYENIERAFTSIGANIIRG